MTNENESLDIDNDNHFSINKMGRPRKEIDYDELEKLLRMQCTVEECASWFGMGEDTLNNRIKEKYGKDMTFPALFKLKGACGKISLRRKQFQKALKGDGDSTMLIWLGKKYLGQEDVSTINVQSDHLIELQKITEEKRQQIINEKRGKNDDTTAA